MWHHQIHMQNVWWSFFIFFSSFCSDLFHTCTTHNDEFWINHVWWHFSAWCPLLLHHLHTPQQSSLLWVELSQSPQYLLADLAWFLGPLLPWYHVLLSICWMFCLSWFTSPLGFLSRISVAILAIVSSACSRNRWVRKESLVMLLNSTRDIYSSSVNKKSEWLPSFFTRRRSILRWCKGFLPELSSKIRSITSWRFFSFTFWCIKLSNHTLFMSGCSCIHTVFSGIFPL